MSISTEIIHVVSNHDAKVLLKELVLVITHNEFELSERPEIIDRHDHSIVLPDLDLQLVLA